MLQRMKNQNREKIQANPTMNADGNAKLMPLGLRWMVGYMGLGFILFKAKEIVLMDRGAVQNRERHYRLRSNVVWVRGCHILRVESDCQQLVNIIHRDEDWLALASDIGDIKALCASFQDLSITYISRSLNICEDTLAKGA